MAAVFAKRSQETAAPASGPPFCGRRSRQRRRRRRREASSKIKLSASEKASTWWWNTHTTPPRSNTRARGGRERDGFAVQCIQMWPLKRTWMCQNNRAVLLTTYLKFWYSGAIITPFDCIAILVSLCQIALPLHSCLCARKSLLLLSS